MTAKPPPVVDRVSVRRDPDTPGVETLLGRFVAHRFRPHAHDGYLIGLIADGVHSVSCRGSRHDATAGTVVTMHPGDIHHGGAGDEGGWLQRMIYIDERRLAEACAGEDGGHRGLPRFRANFHRRPDLASALLAGHRVLHESASRLARDVAFESLLRRITTALATDSPGLADPARRLGPRIGGRTRDPVLRIDQAIDHLHAHRDDEVSLDALCRITGLRRRQTIDAFKRRTGLPPHAYQLQLRINAAQTLLRAGESIADVAARTGFADQSHFARHFLARFGVTPGVYARGGEAGHGRERGEGRGAGRIGIDHAPARR